MPLKLCLSSHSKYEYSKFYSYKRKKDVEFYLFGKIFGNESLDYILDLLFEKKYSDLIYIKGDFSFICKIEDFYFLYYGSTSDYPIYFYKNLDTYYVSDDYKEIATINNIELSNARLAVLCWGANCLPYNDINILKTDNIYIFENEEIKSIYKHKSNYFEGLLNKANFDDFCLLAREMIIESVKTTIDNKKIALTLSGGLDSGVLAICLKKLNADFECFHWTSDEYKPIDEREYVIDLCNKNNINNLNFVDIGKGITNGEYINQNDYFYLPYNHGSFYWWKQTVIQAKDKNCEVLYTGLNGDGLFGNQFIILKFKDCFSRNINWKMKYYISSLTLPYREQYIIKNQKNTQRAEYDYLFLRKADFFNSEYLKHLDQFIDNNIFIQKESLRYDLYYKYDIYNINPYVDKKLIEFSHMNSTLL